MSRRSSNNEPKPHDFGYFPWLLFAAMAVVAPWMLGGRAENAHWVLGAMVWGVVPLVMVAVFMDWRSWRETAAYDMRRGRGTPSPLKTFGKGLAWTLPFLLLMTLTGISLLNPTYAWEGDRLVRQESITWLPTVIDPARSAPGIFFLCGLIAAGAMLVNPAIRISRWLRRWILLGLLANAMVLCWVGLYFNLTGAGEILGSYEPVASYFFATFYYKNHWAAYALLYCGVAAAFFFRDLPRWLTEARRAGSGALALIAIFFLGLTFPLADTRSGILLLGVFGVVVVSGVWRRMPSARARKMVAAGAVAAALVFAALSMNELGRNWERTDKQIKQAGSVAFDGIRLVHGPSVCLEMAGDRPLWGWGYLSYDPLFPVYATDYFRGKDGALRSDMEFAHNDWLQSVAEFGWAGMALLALGAALLLSRRHKETKAHRETHSLDRETHSFQRKTHSLDRETHSLDRETHSLDRETHSLDRKTHSLDRKTHSLDRKTHALDRKTHAFLGRKRSSGNRKISDPSFREGQWIWLAIGLVALFAWWDFPFSNPAVLANTVVLGVVLRRAQGRMDCSPG